MTLKISRELSLPDDAVTETIGILAVKRAGKSNAAVVLAEEMFDAGIPWVAIDPKGDWWGVRSSGDGKGPGLPVLVFGGEHGDVPLEPTAGNLVADLVAEQRITCVLDVSEMTKADQRRFLKDFASRLYRVNREPLHVFCEEADEYIPQRVMGEMAALVGAFETLVKRGGFRGIGITLITQRSASLNKDVLTQIGTLITLRTPSAQDRKAILGWVEHHAAGSEAVAELPGLENGEAFVYSPEWLRTLRRIRFRRRRTFDSGATPTVGERRRIPVTVADVDLAAIKEAMAETIERAKAEDPKALQARIRQLEKELVGARAEKPAEVITETVEVPVVPAAVGQALRSSIEQLVALEEALAEIRATRETVAGLLANLDGLADGVVVKDRTVVRTESAPKSHTTRSEQPRRPTPTRTPVEPSGDLPLGEERILTVVAQYPAGATLEQLTVLTGYKRSSRNTYIQRLRQRGLVSSEGGTVVATDEGLAALGPDFEPLPTGPALQEHWLGVLPAGERAILSELLGAYPGGVELEELSERTGYKRSSRNTYIQRLRSRQLATTGAGEARAAEVLFDG